MKETFACETFASETFACGTWTGLGVSRYVPGPPGRGAAADLALPHRQPAGETAPLRRGDSDGDGLLRRP